MILMSFKLSSSLPRSDGEVGTEPKLTYHRPPSVPAGAQAITASLNGTSISSAKKIGAPQ